MIPLEKILFPVDFSGHCIGASRFVEAMTGRFEAELVLLHVLEPPGYTASRKRLKPRKNGLLCFSAMSSDIFAFGGS